MPETFKKLSVVTKTSNFKHAVSVVHVPLAPPQDDQVLFRNIYAGVNAADTSVAAGAIFTDGITPYDIGFEGLGIIEQIGQNIDKYHVGQTVVIYGGPVKCYAEHLYVNPEEIIPVPQLRPEFIGVAVCGLTAAIGLDEAGRVQQGDKVLITAAAGGVGHMAVQWAKKRGCHVIGMTSTQEKVWLLKRLGADRVINYRTENLDEVLSKEYPSGVDVVWETIGGQLFETLFRHLAQKGRIVVAGSTRGLAQPVIPNLNGMSVQGFRLGGYREVRQRYLKELIEDISCGQLKVTLDFGDKSSDGPFAGIESVVRAVEYLQNGQNIGKVIVKLQECC